MAGISLNCSERNSVPPISHVMFYSQYKHQRRKTQIISLYIFFFAGKDAIYHVAIALVGGGGGGLPYIGYIGMCSCEGYGFQEVNLLLDRVYKSESLGLEEGIIFHI